MMKVRSCASLAVAAGSAAVSFAAEPASIGVDAIKSVKHVYQVGNERVILDDRPVTPRTGEVQVWAHLDPFDFSSNPDGASCVDAIRVHPLVVPSDVPSFAPRYEAMKANASFDPNTVIDSVRFMHSALPEDPSTQNNGVDDPVAFNDLFMLVEDAENIFAQQTDALRTFGVTIFDLPGDDSPEPGFVGVFYMTVDLKRADGAFELGDDNGLAEEDCVEHFNPNSFVDLGFSVDPTMPDGLHDVTFTYFVRQPDGRGGQIDPQDSGQRSLWQVQGMVSGYGRATRAGGTPDVGGPIGLPGDARNSFNVRAAYDLSIPAVSGGVDFSADPLSPEWLDETGPAFLGLQGSCYGQDPLNGCPLVCSEFTTTDPDTGDLVVVPAGGMNEPYTAFFGPIPGTCAGGGQIDPCGRGQRTCAVSDIAPPFGIIDLADVDAFINAFLANDLCVDIAPPIGILDISDIDLFIASFLAGCP